MSTERCVAHGREHARASTANSLSYLSILSFTIAQLGSGLSKRWDLPSDFQRGLYVSCLESRADVNARSA